MNDTTPPAEWIEPGADMAHRDDLARDVARLWRETDEAAMPNELHAALDRLSAAYGEQP